MLAIYLVVTLLAIVLWAAFTESQFFSELLAFSSAIIGSVAGYYFQAKRNNESGVKHQDVFYNVL